MAAERSSGGAAVTVKVTNETSGGKTVAGDAATISVFDQDKEIGNLEGKVGEDGTAVFENVPTGPGFAGVANVNHSGMSFGSGMFALRTDGASLTPSVSVYEVSADNSKLRAGMHHFVVKAENNSIVIDEYVQLINPTDMAITSSSRDEEGRTKVIKVYLPKGFGNLTMLDYFHEDAIVVTSEGFYDIMASPPGEHQTAFRYSVPIADSTVELVKKVSLPTDDLMVFSQLGEGRLKGLGEPSGQMTLENGTPMEYFDLSSQDKGKEIRFQLTGFVVQKSRKIPIVILSVVFGLMVVGAFARAFRKKA